MSLDGQEKRRAAKVIKEEGSLARNQEDFAEDRSHDP